MTWLLGLKGWLIAGAALAVLALLGGQHLRINSLKTSLALEKAAHQAGIASAAETARALEATYRATEQEWQAKHRDTVDDAVRKITAWRADALSADAASQRLSERIASIVAAARKAAANPPTAKGSEATSAALDLLPRMLEGLDRAAGQLSEYADRARTAGEACERSYEALK